MATAGPPPSGAIVPPRHPDKSASFDLKGGDNGGGKVAWSSSEHVEIKTEKARDVLTGATDHASFDGGILYKDDGQLVHLPAPTKDPRDPMNLPLRRKVLGLICLCFFGALAASAELILGSMLSVFALEYSGVDPKIIKVLTETHAFPKGVDPLVFLSQLPNAPPIWHTFLLGSLPLLAMGLSNIFLIPLAIAIGRRPVIIMCGLCAISGAVWAGHSQSLNSHIGARCLQGIGAGTVESLIPFIIQDIVYAHQRNTAISGVFAAQGTIIIALGIAAPYLIIDLSWRWVYFVTAAGAGFFLIGVILFMPETRWHRTKEELEGIPRQEPEDRVYAPRTWRYDLALQHGPREWRKGINACYDSLRTFFYPHIFFVTMLNSGTVASTFAASFTITPHLVGVPYNWPFMSLGFCLLSVLIAAIFVAALTGSAADWVANFFAKKRGRRLPENQLINLILPTASGIVGTILFGLGGSYPDDYPWPVFLLGLGMMAFGALGTNTIGAVYVLESYPQLAGPALVNIASFRCILAFILSFQVSTWVVDMGYLKSMLIYTGVIGGFFLLIPVLYIWGPGWRRRWPGPNRHS
ncbi:major facilitator superfamily transporter [Thozetella sp. PMI_491]|nr:major facilitator superfamily transporter [Thozetella sp. PMI_491]